MRDLGKCRRARVRDHVPATSLNVRDNIGLTQDLVFGRYSSDLPKNGVCSHGAPRRCGAAARRENRCHARGDGRRPGADLLRRRRYEAAAREGRRRPRDAPATPERGIARGRADGRVDLRGRGPADTGHAPARQPGPARAADSGQPVGDSVGLRRRRVREPLALLRPRRGCRRRTREPRGRRDRPHRHRRRPLRGRVLLARTRGLVRHARHDPRSDGDRGVGAPDRRTPRASRRAPGLPVREPRRGDRRHAPPPARPDLRLPLRHAAHRAGARGGRRPTARRSSRTSSSARWRGRG